MLTVNVEAEFDSDRLQQAINHLEKAVAIDPSNPRYRKSLGEALVASRRFEDAITLFQSAHDLAHDPRIAYLIALSFYRLGRPKDALPFVTRVHGDKSVGFARADLLRGRILLDNERFSEAANAFAEASMLNASAREPRWYRAKALIALANRTEEDTTGFYRTALQILSSYDPTPAEEEEWRFLLGRIYLALQHPMQALMHLEQTRHLGGKERVLLLGIALFLQGSRALARVNLADAASEPTQRQSCERYLCEIVASSPDRLRAMGAPESGINAPNQIDREFLVAVFGRNAPEVDRVMNAASRWREGTQTAADMTAGTKGRLFAPLSLGETPSIRRQAPGETDPPKNVATTVEIGKKPPQRRGETTEGPIPTGRLDPRTHVDVGAGLSEVATAGHAVLPHDEDPAASSISTERFEVRPIDEATSAPNDPPMRRTSKIPTRSASLERADQPIDVTSPSDVRTETATPQPSVADTLAVDITDLDDTLIERFPLDDQPNKNPGETKP